MSAFKCTACGHMFESKDPRPPCPHGCRHPFERPTLKGDYVTTEPVAPATGQTARKEPEKKTPAPVNGKTGKCPSCGETFARLDMHIKHCKGRATPEPEKKEEPPKPGAPPADPGTDREGLDNGDSL